MPPDEPAIESMVDKWLDGDNTPAPSGDTPDAPTSTDEGSTPATPTATPQAPGGEPAKPVGDAQRPVDQKTQSKPAPGGDLIVNGQVVAKAGAERRHYEAAQRYQRESGAATRDLQTTRQNLERTTAELNAFREAAQLPTQLGLSPEDTTTGLQLVASWKQNPVGVIQYLVEQAKAAGHTLDGIGGATDMGAIKAMLANELAPFRQQATQVQQQNEAQTAAQRQVDTLVSEFGVDALANSEALAKVIDASQKTGNTLSLEQAYFRFSRWCGQHGFDPHQPIDPQIAAANGQPASQTAQSGQQRMPPRPNGRAPASQPGVVPLADAATTTGNESYRDLVRMSMREAGYNL